MVEVGYRQNEWIVRYNNADGIKQLEFFDTKDEAIDFIKRCEFPVGMMTTVFYDNFVERVIK